MTDDYRPPVNARDVMRRVDMDWLHELMITDELRPAALVEAEQRWSRANQRLDDILQAYADDERVDLIDAHEQLSAQRWHLTDHFWLLVGIQLGIGTQWLADRVHRESDTPIGAYLADELEEGFVSMQYMTAVLAAREVLQEADERA